jgi:NitT/TauT family transport system substrate-binding protein
MEKIIISTSLDTKSALFYIAVDQGYFSHNGLNVTLKTFPSGKMGCEQLKAGKVDIANISDFVLVDQVFSGTKSLRCVGAIAAADDHQLIARKDRGILKPSDLRGRKIGAPHGTSAEFFLGRFLAFNDLTWAEVNFIVINPADLEAALATGRVDAVMGWEQWVEEIKRRMGNNIETWPGQSGQKYYWMLVTTDAFMEARPGVLEQRFRALDQAERFLKNHPGEGIKIIAQWTDLEPASVQAALTRSKCALSFDQSLMIALEDEARWMIRNNLTGQTVVPNYLEYMKVEALSKVNPQAVRLIVPKNQN